MKEWLLERGRDVRRNGLDGVRRTHHSLLQYLLTRALARSRSDLGTPVYERDWDVLVILDACRYDLMEEVQGAYSFLEGMEPVYSVGSHSRQWMENNFHAEYAEEMRRTAFVTGNPYSAEVLDPNDFYLLDEVWRYSWDDSDLQTVRADPITDRLIDVARSEDAERVIAHYMQPHASFVPYPDLATGDDVESIWAELRYGRVDEERVWEAYRANLRYVLDSVAVALENVDADRFVVSSDHGNAVGEWGIYGHPEVPLTCLRKVPWVETTARDTGSYEPSVEPDGEVDLDSGDVSRRLSDLGYIRNRRGGG